MMEGFKRSISFLRRSIASPGSRERGRRDASPSDTMKRNGTPQNSGSAKKRRTKRKRDEDDTQHSKGNKRTKAVAKQLPMSNQSDEYTNPEPTMSSLQLHMQSSVVRQKVLEQIPKELQHDETFVLERMKQSWLDGYDCWGSDNRDSLSQGSAKLKAKKRKAKSKFGDTSSDEAECVAAPIQHGRNKKAASLDANTRNKKRLQRDAVPLRQYYRARTGLPMAPGEWNEDSDDEIDESWLHGMSESLMDEFEDVAAKEKVFMKMWNRYIKCTHVIGDRDMPRKCHEFVAQHKKQLHEGGLRLNLLLHLFNLWDSGVISSNRILSCMSLFDDEVSGMHGK